MMSLTFGLFTQVSGSGPLGPLVLSLSVREYGKLQNVREKSGKSQGILRWIISGNPDFLGWHSIF